ncbi:uncharacterized protein [Arachis hypogaea]|uniref:uncharacterized protein n=1 Tax=Arachis hypogaea TaxID=3818 RepID=UPI000DED0195|nr:uncharacterized protein LOC112794720 [Arachis hypogaea]
MPLYAKFMKELLAKKKKWREDETVVLNKECSAIIQNNLPQKLKDPGSFLIPCTIGEITIERALCDLGASNNLMPFSLMKKMQIDELKSTRISLQLADHSIKFPHGVVENLLVKVGKFILPADFVILDMKENTNTSIILGRPFLDTGRALIDVQKGELILRVHDDHIVFNILKAVQHPNNSEGCMKIDIIDPLLQETLEEEEINNSLKPLEEKDLAKNEKSLVPKEFEASHVPAKEEEAPKLKLKPLPPNLKYAFFGDNNTYPMIISSFLGLNEEKDLLKVLRYHKSSLGWTIGDLTGISPVMYMHKILLEEDSKLVVQAQKQLNLIMKEVVRK